MPSSCIEGNDCMRLQHERSGLSGGRILIELIMSECDKMMGMPPSCSCLYMLYEVAEMRTVEDAAPSAAAALIQC